jgi:glycosyltransferase involved in cell wall biosynthesis
MKFVSISNVKKTIAYIRVCGLKATLKKIWEIFGSAEDLGNFEDYSKWYNRNKPTPEELQQQREKIFPYMPLISIITPTFNTPEKFLREMIESVIFQTYGNWELCIADGSIDDGDTYRVLAEYAAKDTRIKIKEIGKNKGISGNSNEALNLATGDYIALFDHDDLLTPNALYEIVKIVNETEADFIYSDEDKTDTQGKRYFDPAFKPDFSPDYFKTNNYLCHFTVISKVLLEKAGCYFDSQCDGAQDFDLFLRCSEHSQHIYHIAKILYHWRIHAGSSVSGNAAKPYTHVAGKRELQAHLVRMNEKASVLDAADDIPNMYRIKYEIEGTPLISIIIPTCEHQQDLQKCLDSIIYKSTYQNYEILVVENNSKDPKTFEYYKTIDGKNNITVLYYPDSFNYAAINNWAAKQANGDYLVFMNNDIEIITSDWVEEMLMHAQRKNIGAVGAKLLYPDGTVQHGGVILGLCGLAAHYVGINRTAPGYMGRALVVQNLSAVTAALMMVPTCVFKEMEGFDERYVVAFNDVDLCMKIRAANYYIIFNPNVEAFHYESKSRGKDDTKEKRIRAQKEIELFYSKWGRTLYDPYYNENLSLKQAFTLKRNK